jgi:hypothetical protein
MMSHLEAKNHDGIPTEVEAAWGFISGNNHKKQMSLVTDDRVESVTASEDSREIGSPPVVGYNLGTGARQSIYR